MSKAESAASTSTARAGWSSLQVNLMNKKMKVADEIKDWIVLDNGSMLSPLMNPKLVERIRESKNTLELATITTEGSFTKIPKFFMAESLLLARSTSIPNL